MTLGQIWSNSITQNDDASNVKPVTTNESIVNQNMENNKYHSYKKGILNEIINGGKLKNEPETSK